jgi:hypothetical protein
LTPLGAAPQFRWPILLIQPPLRRVKPLVDQSSLSDRHWHWPPTQLHSHRHRCPHHHCVVLECVSCIGRPPLHQIHAAAVLLRLPPPIHPLPDPAVARCARRPIWPLPDPPATPITLPPHRSGRSCADPPPPEKQSIASTTVTSLLFEHMRDQQPWACAWLFT